ncbi:MAG: CHAT domain protein [Syntrophorhabdus sp. PtaU1.Bin002]|nr:MAG: CHAT domain protein [Syntrophorhabdus sp. PtaU1.Bin002]
MTGSGASPLRSSGCEKMGYKEFRVLITDEENVRATPPDQPTIKSKVVLDPLMRKTLEVFQSLVKANKIQNREQIEVFGSHLYKVLFNGKVDTAFKAVYDTIQTEERLRLILEFEPEARDLATLPWEYIYYPDKEDERGFQIATKSKLILTRHVPLTISEKDLKPREKPLRICIVVSQPTDEYEVKSQDVINAMENLKKERPEDIGLSTILQPDNKSFGENIGKLAPHVLHFIGHGQWDPENRKGKLAFVSAETGKAVWIDDKGFSDYFEDFQPRLIFLHACEGARSESYEGFRGVALQLVYSKVPAVVAMQYPIENKVAIAFANKFYKSIGEGKPVDVAVQEGRHELGMYLDEEHFSSRAFGSPVVYLQSADGIIVAESQPVPEVEKRVSVVTGKVDCPNPKCDGKVRPGADKCLLCEHFIMACPRCGWQMDKTIGKCDHCPYTLEKTEQLTATIAKTETGALSSKPAAQTKGGEG